MLPIGFLKSLDFSINLFGLYLIFNLLIQQASILSTISLDEYIFFQNDFFVAIKPALDIGILPIR